MPLKGEAKTAYQRGYMRKVRKDAATVALAITERIRPRVGRPRKFSADVQHVAQAELQKAANRNGLTLDLTLSKVRELHNAQRLVKSGKEATMVADNDAQRGACDLAFRYVWAPRENGEGHTTSSGARVRMVQIEPDGTERILEIG